MHRETNLITRVLKAGAHGYISKDSDPKTLIMAIRAVAEGGQFLDPVLGAQLVFDDSDSKILLRKHLLIVNFAFYKCLYVVTKWVK